jgi:hypothetical protein
VSFVAFYEQGFGMPTHQLLRLLLQYYSFELHNLTPSGVLHIAAFVTLCEAYLSVDPGSGGGDILIKSRHGVDPYHEIPMPRLMKGWQKKCVGVKYLGYCGSPVTTQNSEYN